LQAGTLLSIYYMLS
jgi:transposase